MCGIFGYIGSRNHPLEICLEGLKRLEYRGYDSAGIAGIAATGTLLSYKQAGKIVDLEKVVYNAPLIPMELAIGHTRWATHGPPTDKNAHPHYDVNKTLALVHNGIIENHRALRITLEAAHFVFESDTDTEVIAHLISYHYTGNLLEALQKALSQLHGSFALAIVHASHPDQILVAARDNPLCIGFNDEKTESVIASDPNALCHTALNALFLNNNEIGVVQAHSIDIYNFQLEIVPKKLERLKPENHSFSKGGFEHFMLKEIFEQSDILHKLFQHHWKSKSDFIEWDHPLFSQEDLRPTQNIWLIGCGTSAHAGSLGVLLFEEIAQISSSMEIASEARYRTSLISPDTLVIAISQSGETADTIGAMREARQRGCKILGICNVKNSTLHREADSTLFLQAGPEVSVCSTKAFSSQVAVLTLFAIYLAQLRGKSVEHYFEPLQQIPEQIHQVLHQKVAIEQLAKKYAHYNNFFFMGRRYMFPTALEAALKLKEISYVHANGYPAGELKHGPIALLDAHFPVVAFCANQQTQDKIASNLMEVKARHAPVLAFAPQDNELIRSIADDVISLPVTLDALAPFASAIASQLFAYYFAKTRGCNIDQPRNLAKSVTVE